MKVNLYLYMPVNNRLVHYQKKGETLPVQKLMEIMKFSGSIVLVPEAETREALAAISQEMSEDLKVDGPITSEISTKAENLMRSMVNSPTADPKTRQKDAQRVLDESAQLANQVISQFKSANLKSGMQQLLENIKKEKNSLEGHERHVASLAVMCFLALREGTTADVSDLAMAGLIHDAGLKDQPESDVLIHVEGLELKAIIKPDVQDPVPSATPKLDHIEHGIASFKALGLPITDGVMKIVAQHHENQDGTGPWGLKGSSIFRPARILRIADDLVCLLNSKWHNFDLPVALGALAAINSRTGGASFYDPLLIAQLQKILIAPV